MVEEFLINSSAQILSVVHAISVALRRYFVVPNPTFALLNTGHGGPSVSSAARSISGVFRDWVCAAWQSAPRYTHSAVQGHGQQRCYKPAHHSDRSFKKHGKKKPAEKHTHTRMRTKFPNPKFPSSHYSRTLHLLKRINKDPVLRERALAFGISDELFSAALQDYSLSSLHANAMSTILKELAFLEEDEAFAAIFNDFLEFCKHKYKSRIEKHKLLVETLDMSNPKSWYPMARSMTRTVIYHAGPTNSGKTYNALKAMSQAGSGVYLGPLRLLAMEVYDSLNQSGTLCNLITGQERREVPSATHTACTVEMCNLSSPVDVAVIDEIQLIGDQSRGYAWTRALLGVPAREVHLCGDTSALELVRWLCSQAQERLEVKSYERFTPLEIEPLRQDVDQTYEIVRPGDCIVAFSRSDIFNIKAQVEVLTPYKACVIYGALPPETRRQQARLFNDPSNEYSVMVASDAVGMGLNLNIGRIIFHTLQKGPRTGLIDVDPSAIKQIAGRAGRRSSQFSVGKVSCISPRDLKKVRQALRLPPSASLTERAGLAPEFDHFEAFAARFPEMPLHQIVDAFANQSSVQGPYFFCKQEPMVVAASLLGRVKGLTLRDLYSFVTAPASLSDKNVLAALLHWAKRYAKGQPCPLYIDPPDVIPISTTEMRTIETAHAIVSLWLWLSFRFDEEYFSDRDRAQDVAEQLSNLLSRGLESMSDVDDKAVFGFLGLEKTSSKRRQSIVSWAETTYMLAWANELEDVTHWLRDGWRT